MSGLTAALPDKGVGEILDYQVTMPVEDGDTVVSHQVTNDGGAVVGNVSRNGAVVTFFLSGGVPLQAQRITVSVVTSQGRTIERVCTLTTH